MLVFHFNLYVVISALSVTSLTHCYTGQFRLVFHLPISAHSSWVPSFKCLASLQNVLEETEWVFDSLGNVLEVFTQNCGNSVHEITITAVCVGFKVSIWRPSHDSL